MLIRALVFAAFLLPLASLTSAEDLPRQIIVTGTGQVATTPDLADIRLGVTHEDQDAKGAMDRVSRDVRAMLSRLDSFGLQARDVQTTSLRLDPVWSNYSGSQRNGQQEIVGFVARNEIGIRLRDFARLGELLDVLLNGGANHFSGVSFGVAAPAPLLDKARALAVADARRKAELYAEAAGVTLGAVQEIREPGAAAAPSPRMMRAEMVVSDSGMPVAGGELTFSAQITVIYAIAE